MVFEVVALILAASAPISFLQIIVNLSQDTVPLKGEHSGIETEYTANNGTYGRGAPANGGGGGGTHNTGGGGGANGFNGGTWTGAGSPDTSDMSWDNAWDLDDLTDDVGTPLPAYFSGGAGGGRGGYSYADVNADATLVGPNDGTWGGNTRLQVGGLGGRPLSNDPNTRLFLGGGAGAGDDNNLTGTPGGAGGGLIIIAASMLNGSGQIAADGVDADDALPPYQDGAGGGGAGGTVVLKLNSVSGTVTLNAVGGAGGDIGVLGSPTDFPNESFGPGGGGGGGFVDLDSNAGSLTIDVSGGVNGITASEALDEFIPNGATAGYSGLSSTTTFSFPGCSSPTAISLSFADVSAHLNHWPVLLFLLLLGISGLLLLNRPNHSR